MSAYEGSKQQEKDEDYARLHGKKPLMFGGNKVPPLTEDEIRHVENIQSQQNVNPYLPEEKPLTHHQQAVKDFMIVLAHKTNWKHEIVAEEAAKFADAFIKQIKS